MLAFGRMSFHCPNTSRSILRSVAFATGPNRAATVVKDAKDNGSALMGLVPHFCSIASNSVALSKISVHRMGRRRLQRGLKCIPRGKILFSKSVTSGVVFNGSRKDSSRVVRTTRVTRTARFVSAGPRGCGDPVSRKNSGMSNKRGRELSVTETVTGRPRMFVFSSDFSTLSCGASMALHHTLTRGADKDAILVITREVDAVLRTRRVVMLSRNGITNGKARTRLLGGYPMCHRVTRSRLSEGRLRTTLGRRASKGRSRVRN